MRYATISHTFLAWTFHGNVYGASVCVRRLFLFSLLSRLVLLPRLPLPLFQEVHYGGSVSSVAREPIENGESSMSFRGEIFFSETPFLGSYLALLVLFFRED